VLQVLKQEPGRAFSRTGRGERVWRGEHEWDARTVEIFVAQLRKKVDSGSDAPLTWTVRAVDYALRVPA
jgi:DNA-binding response OmpR family regulator